MSLTDIINKITKDILNPLIVLLFALATAVFVWGVVLYVLGGAGSSEQAKTAKQVILWGIIGMFIMASAWGIVNLLCDFFGLSSCT
jgi:hypothetical protein